MQATERLLRWLTSLRVEQFIFSSTMLVHAPCAPGERIDEDSPLRPRWEFPRSKLRTEGLILSWHGTIPAVLLRLAGVYTGHCESPPLARQIQRIYERRPTAKVFPGDISRGRSHVHLDDAVEAFRDCVARQPALPPETVVLIGEPDPLGYDEPQRAVDPRRNPLGDGVDPEGGREGRRVGARMTPARGSHRQVSRTPAARGSQRRIEAPGTARLKPAPGGRGMWLRTMSFIALIFAAVALGPALAHLLELANKIHLSREDYLTVQQIYRGWALLGVVVAGALSSTLILTILLRRARRAFAFGLIAFSCLVGTQVVFWTYTYPANQATRNWTVLPEQWAALRRQWEYSHATSAVLNLVAFSALVLAVLARKE